MSLILSSPGAREAVRNASLARLLSDAVQALEHEPERVRISLVRAVDLLRAALASAPSSRRGGLTAWQAKKTLVFIEEQLENGPRIIDLAAHLGLSQSHFSRAFKEFFGQSPQQLILERRIERAKGLMLTTDEKLCDVAHACGFADQAHFSRMFHRVVGLPPNAWRRSWAHV